MLARSELVASIQEIRFGDFMDHSIVPGPIIVHHLRNVDSVTGLSCLEMGSTMVGAQHGTLLKQSFTTGSEYFEIIMLVLLSPQLSRLEIMMSTAIETSPLFSIVQAASNYRAVPQVLGKLTTLGVRDMRSAGGYPFGTLSCFLRLPRLRAIMAEGLLNVNTTLHDQRMLSHTYAFRSLGITVLHIRCFGIDSRHIGDLLSRCRALLSLCIHNKRTEADGLFGRAQQITFSEVHNLVKMHKTSLRRFSYITGPTIRYVCHVNQGSAMLSFKDFTNLQYLDLDEEALFNRNHSDIIRVELVDALPQNLEVLVLRRCTTSILSMLERLLQHGGLPTSLPQLARVEIGLHDTSYQVGDAYITRRMVGLHDRFAAKSIEFKWWQHELA